MSLCPFPTMIITPRIPGKHSETRLKNHEKESNLLKKKNEADLSTNNDGITIFLCRI